MYRLLTPTTPEEWEAYHSIREHVLWIARGRVGVYDRRHQDEYAPGHYPLLLTYGQRHVAVARLDVKGDVAWLRRVAVASDVQRHGHGRALLNYVQRLAAEKGCIAIRSNVDPGAVDFYLRNGFRRLDIGAGGASVPMEKLL